MKVRFAGYDPHERRPRQPTPKPVPPAFIAIRPSTTQAPRYLRRLRAWVAGTPAADARAIIDKIDDLIFQAERE